LSSTIPISAIEDLAFVKDDLLLDAILEDVFLEGIR
jgi:hypothetical protein